MPVNPEALLISSIVRDGDFEIALKTGITPEMFHAYQQEFEWVADFYYRHRKSPSKMAFRNKFPEFRVKTANDTAHFSDEVRLSHARHALTGVMREAAQYLAKGDIEEAVDIVQHGTIKVAADMGTMNDGDIIRDFDDILDDIDSRRTRFEETGSAGVPSGFPTLDEELGGFQPGDLVIFGARLGEGKSYTMQRMCAAAIQTGYTVNFHALEQNRAAVSMRIYGFLSGQLGAQLFKSTELMQGKDYDAKKFKEFVRGLKDIIDGRLHVSDRTRGKVSATTIMAGVERTEPDIVFIDYLTLMKRGPDWQGVAELTSDLLGIGNEYGIPIGAAAQLNREFGLSRKGEPPGPEALAQADAIGQDATVVCNSSPWSERVLVGKCVKSRNTRGGFKWYSHFDPDHGRYEEITYPEAERLVQQDDDNRDKEAVKGKARRG